MRYYLVADLVSHAWERSHQIAAESVNALLGPVPREEVPHHVEGTPQRELPDGDMIGGGPPVEVVAESDSDQPNRRLVGRLLVCPNR